MNMPDVDALLKSILDESPKRGKRLSKNDRTFVVKMMEMLDSGRSGVFFVLNAEGAFDYLLGNATRLESIDLLTRMVNTLTRKIAEGEH